MAEGDIQITLDDEPTLTGEDDLGGEAPKAPLSYKDEEANLVEIFMDHPEGKEALKKIAETVHEDFKADFESTADYREIMAKIWALFIGDLPEKVYPYKNSANPHVPVLLESISRIAFRAFDELFGDWQNVFGVLPVGPADADVAEVLTLHGNWQFRQGIPDVKRQMHRGMLAHFLFGDVTYQSSYDPVLRCNVHELLTPDDFVTPYMHVSTRPDYGDCPHYTRILNYHRHQLQRMKDTWANVDEVIDKVEPAWGDDPESVMGRAAAEAQGRDIDSSSAAPYRLLQYEGYLELPNQERDRWCQVILDYHTRNILKLCIHEEADWRDAQRFEQQDAELRAYRQAAEEHKTLLEQQATASALVESAAGELQGKGELGPMQSQLIQEQLQSPDGQLPPEPQPPSWLQNPDDPSAAPEPPYMSPILLFTHGTCIESLVGNLGVGYGAIVAPMNRAANTALSQFTDSATFANIPWNLVPGNFEFKTKPEIEPGLFLAMPGMSAEDIQNGVRQMQTPQPSPALMELVNLMHELGQSSVQSPEALSGAPGKSGETYAGLNERIEQATKQLSVPTRKFADVFERVAMCNAKLNSVFLPDGEIEAVISQQVTVPADMQGALMLTAKRGRELYRRSYQVEIKSDLRFTSQAQRIQEADQVVALTAPGAPMEGNLPLRQYALKKRFEVGGRRDLIPFLGPFLPPPQTPLGLPPPPPPGMPVVPTKEGEKPPGKPAAPNAAPKPPTQPGAPGLQ